MKLCSRLGYIFMAGEENSTGLYSDDICCVVIVLYAAFFGGVCLAGERGLCDNVKSVVLTPQCVIRNLVKDNISK
jgi:hypothetical protein